MIKLNNKKFAETEKEFINSLFEPGGTCNGYAQRLKNKIKLFNAQRELIGIINKHAVLCKALLLNNGKYWFSYGTIKEVGEYADYGIQHKELHSLI